MNSSYSIELKNEEIIVLAALLGYKYVLAVEIKDRLSRKNRLTSLVTKTMHQMEHKGYIRYELDSTLYIMPQIRLCIESVCTPQRVLYLSDNLSSALLNQRYIINQSSYVVVMTVHKASCSFSLIEKARFDMKKTLGLQDNTQSEVDEKILLEEAKLAQKSILGFDVNAAESVLMKSVFSQSSVSLILDILSRRCNYLRMKSYTKSEQSYSVTDDVLISFVNDKMIRVFVDEYDVVSFLSINADEISKIASEMF